MKKVSLFVVLILLISLSAFAQATVQVQPTTPPPPTFEKLVVTDIVISFAPKEKGSPLAPQPSAVTIAYQITASDGTAMQSSVRLVDTPEIPATETEPAVPAVTEASTALRTFLGYNGNRPEGMIARKRLIDWLVSANKITGVVSDTP